MARDNVFNFSAGPSVMPLPALESARDQLPDYMGSGVSVMEMSHRSKQFQEIFESTKLKLRTLMQVPETHDILFLQGGATTMPSPATSQKKPLRRRRNTAASISPATARPPAMTASPPRRSLAVPRAPNISITAPTTLSTAPNGSTCPESPLPWYATCPPTFSLIRWMCPASASYMPGPRRTWPLPVSPW